MQYTYNLNCCSQFTKDEMQISVLGLYGQAPAGEVHDNPGGEIQSNPCTEERGRIAFIPAQEQHYSKQWIGKSTAHSTGGVPLPPHPVVQQDCSFHSCQKTTLELEFSFALKVLLLRSPSACKWSLDKNVLASRQEEKHKLSMYGPFGGFCFEGFFYSTIHEW